MSSLGEGGETETDASGRDGHGAARTSTIRERAEKEARRPGLMDPEGVGAFDGAVGGDGGGMTLATATAVRAATAALALHAAHVSELSCRRWSEKPESERSRAVEGPITSRRGTVTEQGDHGGLT